MPSSVASSSAPNPIRQPASNRPPPLPQSATPLAPWTPPVQGRPVTLPAFEVSVAPPPVQAAPVTAAVASPNPFVPSATVPAAAPAEPVERAAPPNPFMRATSPVERAAAPNPFAQSPSPAAPPAREPEPVVSTVPVAPPLQPVLAAIQPVLAAVPAVQPSTTSAVDASPAHAPAHPSHSERPGYFGPSAPPEDANPVVRPEPGYVSPVPPRVAERAAESPVAPRVAEAATVAPSVEPLDASGFVPPMENSPALVEWPKKEPEPPLAAATPNDEPASAPESTPASAHDEPVTSAPAVEPSAQANAFETAPTEFAASETPIAQPAREHAATEVAQAEEASVDVATSDAAALSGAADPALATAVIASEATSAPSNPESVVMEAEIQDHAVPLAQTFPAPRPFTSSGSEMPVVITAPPPHQRDTAAPSAKLFDLGRELLPKAEAWSRKVRTSPRALVITAPLLALLGILAVRGLVSHTKHTPVAEAPANAVAEVAAATPAPETTTQNPAAPASAILVLTATAPAAAAPAADPAELAAAVSHGLPELEALARKFPNDPQVGIALAGQQAQAQRFEAAVESVERVIAVDAKSAQNGKVMGILWRAAQSSATEPSFAALRKLGAKGADVTLDLAITAGVRDTVRDRAKTELKSLSADASADTRVATALLLAEDCAARKALLPRAEHEGAKRTQALLEQYSRGAACTSNTDKSCNACLTGSPALAHALSQLSAGGSK